MIDYDEIIEESPFILNNLISLLKTHDFYIEHYISNFTEISPSQYYMFMCLYYDLDWNQSDIAKACFMDRSGVSRAFKEFEEKELVIREVDESNKRAYKMSLTDKGIKTAKFLEKKEIEWDEMICEDLDKNRDEILKLLSNLSLKSLKFNRKQFND